MGQKREPRAPPMMPPPKSVKVRNWPVPRPPPVQKGSSTNEKVSLGGSSTTTGVRWPPFMNVVKPGTFVMVPMRPRSYPKRLPADAAMVATTASFQLNGGSSPRS